MTTQNAIEVSQAATDIVKFVAAYYGVRQSDIIKRWTRSTQNLAHAKIAATCLLKDAFPNLSSSALSSAFGGKHHSLALARVQAARKLYGRDMLFKACLDQAKEAFCLTLKTALSIK